MVLGYHVVMTTYGFWLPNDPRGSWSDFVGAWELYRYGPATKTDTRISVANRTHNHELRMEAKRALKYPPVFFTGVQARAVGKGFATSITKGKVNVLACAILPDHVHLVIGRHKFEVEILVNFLKGESTKQLLAEELHPLAGFRTPKDGVPRCWAESFWKVFLDSAAAIRRAIEYVENNPVKEGKPRQHWPFVQPYIV